MILLPYNKFEAWSNNLCSVIEVEKTTFGELRSTVGCLNYARYVIPLSWHFLNQIRLWIKDRQHKNQQIMLNRNKIRDPELWAKFLQQA
jgi:hypothetical protein